MASNTSEMQRLVNGSHVDDSGREKTDDASETTVDPEAEIRDEKEGTGFLEPSADTPDNERVRLNRLTGDIEDYERGHQLYLSDGISRIDYVLVWTYKNTDKRRVEKENTRRIFEENLKQEGLILEWDIKEGRPHQFVKIHAPWEVLTRYAEIMKIRMPINEPPQEVSPLSLWDVMTNQLERLLTPFQLDPKKVPPLPKKYTYPFERNKMYLYKIPEGKRDRFMSNATRSRIVDYILRRKEYSEEGQTFSFGVECNAGIRRLIADGTYLAAYPLHEGGWKRKCKMNIRRLLSDNWASWRVWYKIQPLHYIKVYLGEKIGLYFAWLGYYTYSLIPPSIVGLLVFIYGIVTIAYDPISQESCNANNSFTMCPMCNKRCGYWDYDQICLHIKATHMFDNSATVFFAIFMSLWGTFYLEFWKREQAGIQFLWDLRNFEEEEEPPRPEYLARLANCRYKKKHSVTGTEEPYYPYWSRQVPVYLTSTAIMLFLVLVAIGAVIGIVFYRISVLAALYMIDEPMVYKNATLVVSATAAFINLIVIFVLNFVYTRLATSLTDWECLRTQSEYDNSLTFKFYVLQFVNYYSSLFYIAFFKGRFSGTPALYVTFFGARQEECQGGSCLTELCIQLAIIFVGKQLIQNNLMEIFIPRIKRGFSALCRKQTETERLKHPWEKDFKLEEMGPIGLFNEYLEMMVQFGFVTLFVAAFPLAPFFALINNIIELRSDADKFVSQYRRRMAARAQDIGIWYDILYGLTRLAVLTNGLIIAFTSSFIQRAVYRFAYSPTGTLNGYVNNSLAYFNISDFTEETRPAPSEIKPQYNETELCRYPDYREPPWSPNKYNYTTQYWHVVAAQFSFLVVFENLVIVTTSIIAYVIPDVPRKLNDQMRQEAVITNNIILEAELRRARGEDPTLSESVLANIRSRAAGNQYNSGSGNFIRMSKAESHKEMDEVAV